MVLPFARKNFRNGLLFTYQRLGMVPETGTTLITTGKDTGISVPSAWELHYRFSHTPQP